MLIAIIQGVVEEPVQRLEREFLGFGENQDGILCAGRLLNVEGGTNQFNRSKAFQGDGKPLRTAGLL